MQTFNFTPIKLFQKKLVLDWLVLEHNRQWIHGDGLQNTIKGIDSFFQGKTSTIYWIGYDADKPFSFLITSPEDDDAICLDVFICDINYLGKGLAVPMIQQFLISKFPKTKKILIDPEATNSRAIHVYKKIGFKIMGEFIAPWHPVPHYQMELYMNDLLKAVQH